jgi:tRNA (guanine-N7-)-methyltransferase
VDSKKNFVVLKDFAQNIDKIFVEWEISQTYIFFPDPWANKERQKKNRLLQAQFLKNLHTITKTWGKLFFKTDHKEYFDATREIIEQQWLWKTVTWTHNYENTEIFDMDNITEFESFYRGVNTNINYIELAS